MRRAGFTLVELSIVLVILGLLVGGVLAGQSLIKSAEMRSQFAQLEKFRVAHNAFVLKYDNLPGDIPPALATPLGLETRLDDYESYYGDHQLQGAGNNVAAPRREITLYWRDLADTGLIEGQFQGNHCPWGSSSCTTTDTTPLDNILPKAKLPNNNITVWQDGRHIMYGFLSSAGIIDATGAWMLGYGEGQAYGMTQIQAYTIDTKLDDGLPLTGRVISRRNFSDGGGYLMGLAPSAWGGSYCNSYTEYTLSEDTPWCGISVSD